jgi:selenide,water dikinase
VSEILRGGAEKMAEAGGAIVGGHTIIDAEPKYGLCVVGFVHPDRIFTKAGAQPGETLYLTKPLGVGILTTAQKQKVLEKGHEDIAVQSMCTLNRIGAKLGPIDAVTAMTDVTGFGLAGHLSEICEGSGVRAIVDFDRIPLLQHVSHYLELGCSPGGTDRNFASTEDKLGPATEFQQKILCDPQTSGGLLVIVDANGEDEFLAVAADDGLTLQSIGRIVEGGPGAVIEIS